ncbi:hypothetical protein Ciccas_002762 [Cichlidogyrus casuarinus]|uniref:Malonyl-CoA decarboxylase C-terminal domain-containing protein n=1 Tax=Cichlidogyrus casuarinus TaxID=1844966 RepID=A0ABD2QJJ3_9PLAT
MHQIINDPSYFSSDTVPSKNFEHYSKVHQDFTPAYRQFLINFSKSLEGIEFLVDLREKYLELPFQDKATFPIQLLSYELFRLLQLCFSPAFLKLQRITWGSPTALLERVAVLESVHPIRSWLDLKSRLGPYRRVFVNTHPALGEYQPVIILHTALVDHIPSSVDSLISQQSSIANTEGNLVENRDKIKAAIFYSISSPQKGLKGIELGGVMIKSVVREINREFPKLNIFSTISPIPNFRAWLSEQMNKHVDTLASPAFQSFFTINTGVDEEKKFVMNLRSFLDDNFSSPNQYQEQCPSSEKVYFHFEGQKFEVKDMLIYFCTFYLTCMKSKSNKVLNSVAHFHLTNGAQLWRLNWNANINPRGIQSSFGIMANYRYYIAKTDLLNTQYLEHGTVSLSSSVHEVYQSIPENFRTCKCSHQEFDD